MSKANPERIRRVAFFSTSFPPYADSQTIRYTQYLCKLPNNIKVDLFVPGDALDAHCIHGLSNNFTYIYCGTPFFMKLLKLFSFNSRLTWIWKNIGYYFLFPDQFSGFQRKFISRFKKEISNGKQYELLVTSGGSVVAHLAGLRLKVKNDLKWIGEFGDPWHLIDKKFKPWFSPLSKIYEKRIISRVDQLIFTSEATAAAYRKTFCISQKCNVLYYGYCENDFASFIVRKKSHGKIKLSHIGASHVADRDLSKVIDFVSTKPNSDLFELHIIGNHSLSYEQQVAKSGALNIFFKDRVSFEESIEYMASADVLLLVGNKGDLQIPGKVFHCLAARKPIIYLNQQKLKNDPCWLEVLQSYPLVLSCFNDENDIKSKISYASIATLLDKRDLVINEIESQLFSYESQSISAKFLEIAFVK